MPEARSETDPHAAAKAKAIADMRAEAEAANNPANYPYGSAEKPVQVEPQTAGLQQQETTARVAGQPSGVIYDESGNAYTINEAGQPEQLTPQLTSAKITPDELQKSETNLEGTGPETSAQADASTTNTHDTGISTKNAYTD